MHPKRRPREPHNRPAEGLSKVQAPGHERTGSLFPHVGRAGSHSARALPVTEAGRHPDGKA